MTKALRETETPACDCFEMNVFAGEEKKMVSAHPNLLTERTHFAEGFKLAYSHRVFVLKEEHIWVLSNLGT